MPPATPAWQETPSPQGCPHGLSGFVDFFMTLRLRLSSPEPDRTELFRAGPPLRPMRVMADADALRGGPGPVTAEDLLAGLLTSEGILLWRYSDDGPPSGTPQLMTES